MSTALLPEGLESQLRDACFDVVHELPQKSQKAVSFCGAKSETAEDKLSGTARSSSLARSYSCSALARRRGPQLCPVFSNAITEQRLYCLSEPQRVPAFKPPLKPRGIQQTSSDISRRIATELSRDESTVEGDSLSKLLKKPESMLPQFPPQWLLQAYPGRPPPPKPQHNYDDEARKLWARLNLDPTKESHGRFNSLDAIWSHPRTKAKIYVGNASAAKNLDVLQERCISRIVNCTDSIPNYHERLPGLPIAYLRFDIVQHHLLTSDAEAIKFVQPLLNFVSNALEQGENVMLHCLAGAHRAGTTGIICLMHFAKLSAKDAIFMAKECRPIIDPIGDFPSLLARFERCWQHQ